MLKKPQGFEKKGEDGKVYKLKRAIYGLNQGPQAWYSRIEGYFLNNSFEKYECEPTLFTKVENICIFIVSLYVDYLIYTGNCDELIMELQKCIKS